MLEYALVDPCVIEVRVIYCDIIPDAIKLFLKA